jgi:hypothetical protein
VWRIVKHQRALQRIARRNGDTREVLSGGYQGSLDYVVRTLRRAGYTPTIDMFNFPVWEETAPAVLNRVLPSPKVYRYGTAADDDSPNVDFITLGYAGTGTLTNARVVPTNDILDPPPAPGASTSGCEAADYTPQVVATSPWSSAARARSSRRPRSPSRSAPPASSSSTTAPLRPGRTRCSSTTRWTCTSRR